MSIILHKVTPDFLKAQSGIHGSLFHSNDCRKEVARLKAHGVKVTLEPEEQPWGVQAVFLDLYGHSHVILWSPVPWPRGRVVWKVRLILWRRRCCAGAASLAV